MSSFKFSQESSQGRSDDVALPSQSAQVPDLVNNPIVGSGQVDCGLSVLPQCSDGSFETLAEPSQDCLFSDEKLYGTDMAVPQDLFAHSEESVLQAALQSKALPLQWLLTPKSPADLSLLERRSAPPAADEHEVTPSGILSRLVQLEAREPRPEFKSDYRQAFICLTLALRGNSEPFNVSSYQMYGKSADKLWPAIVAQRKSRYGRLYSSFFDENDVRRPGPTEDDLLTWAKNYQASLHPKKPVQSVTREKKEEAA